MNDGAPAAAGRRGGVEWPRASLADPPSISGPAASAWRPMTAACRAHDRAAPPPPRPFAGAGRRRCPQQQPRAGGSRNPRPSGGSSVDLRACSIIPAAQDSSLPGSWRRRSPTAACPLSVGAGRRQCPPQQPGVGPLNGLAPPWRLPRRSPGQQHHRDGQGQQPAGLVAAPFPHRRVPFACRCWPPAVPAAAARRWAVERPLASLATPPLISRPAASS